MLVVLLLLILSICSIYLCKKKKYKVLIIITVAVLAVVMGNNEQIADTSVYLSRYNNTVMWSLSDSQWAMSIFMSICKFVGLSYVQFRVVYFAVGMSILFYVVQKFTNKISWFIILYFLYTMIIDAVQLKNFMAMCFLTLALSKLVKGGIKGSIQYIIFCLVAAGFQIIAYAYLPFVVFSNSAIKKRYRIFSCLPILVFALLFSNRYMSSILSGWLLDTLQGNILERASRFILGNLNNGYLVYFVATLAYIFFTFVFNKEINNSDASINNKRIGELAFLCSLYSLLFMPLYFHAQDFSRLLRNFIVLMHLTFILDIEAKNGYKPVKIKRFSIKKKNIINLGYVLFMIYMFYWDIAIYWDAVVVQFFEGGGF